MKALLSKSYCVVLNFFSSAGRWCSVFPLIIIQKKCFSLCQLFELRRTFLRPKSSFFKCRMRARVLSRRLFIKNGLSFSTVYTTNDSLLSTVSRERWKFSWQTKCLRFLQYGFWFALFCAWKPNEERDTTAYIQDQLDFNKEAQVFFRRCEKS